MSIHSPAPMPAVREAVPVNSQVSGSRREFDMSLIRSIHTAPIGHCQMVGNLVRMVRDLGVVPLAEGVECEEERQACVHLGFELAQGFHFGKPAPLR